MVKYPNKQGYTVKVVPLLLCIVSSVHSWKTEQCFGQFCSNTFSMLSFILKGAVVVAFSFKLTMVWPLMLYSVLAVSVLFPSSGLTVFETGQRKIEKRKKFKENDASNIDGFLGPWAKYVDEKEVAKPSEVSTALTKWIQIVSTRQWFQERSRCTSACPSRRSMLCFGLIETIWVVCPNRMFQIFCIQLFGTLFGN